MPVKQDPFIGDSGASDYDDKFIERSLKEYGNDDYYSSLNPPRVETDNLGRTFLDNTPPNNDLGISLRDTPRESDNTYGVDLSTGLDLSDYGRYLEPKEYEAPVYMHLEIEIQGRTVGSVGTSPPPSSRLDGQIFLAPLVPVNIPVYPPDKKNDWQITISLPKFKVGPDAAFQVGWGDSGRTFGGQAGFNFLPYGQAGIFIGFGVNIDDPMKSELNLQPKLLNLQVNPEATKITAQEIRDGVEDYVREMMRKINEIYGVPHP